ncbi:hypothetical protein B0H19DRAFT_1375318 [Mycena capillaripes]|nr:hypothetical protein B0H19DRAFT_1375318 [Mycena capillaripes]
MLTTTLPQELIDAIVYQVDATHALKACSLVSSQFRSPSQQILLRSLSLDDYPPNYNAASTLLDESPHIARYIKDFRVRLTWVPISAPSYVEDFLELVRKLLNVGRFAISAACDWDVLAPVIPAILDLIGRPNLTELHLSGIENLFPATLALSLASVPTLSLKQVTIATSNELHGDPTDPPCATAKIDRLILSHCKGLDDFFARREYSHYIATLRTLCIRPQSEFKNVVSAAALTLDHIELDCLGTLINSRILRLPPLAALRSMEFVVNFLHTDTHEARFVDILASLLASGPATLKEISIMCPNYLSPTQRPLLQTLTAMDAVVADCASAPYLRWRVRCSMDEDGQRLCAFVKIVQDQMPRLNEKGKVSVDQLDEMRKWP